MNDVSNQGDKAKPGSAPQRVSLFGRPRAPTPPERPQKPAPEKPPRRRRSGISGLSGALSFALIFGLLGLGVIVWSVIDARKPGPLAADKVVLIDREDDGGPIGDQLEHAGVIDSGLWFSVMTLLDGSRGGLKRGEYAFKAGVSLRDVESELLSGRVVLHTLTIPEGLTSDQVVQRLNDNDVLIGDIKEAPREGSLLPETYKFARGETRQALLAKMARDQAKTVDEIWAKRASDLPIKSPGELVTLASIIEKETGKVDERPRVAGVFVNRLRKHMKLESDPTIVYGLVFGKGTLGHSISKAELQESTPYNTYIIAGLPPGPICNPGKAALEAAANPATTKDIFFVADGTGGHAFAETLDQHLKNVAHWRDIEKDAKDKLAPDAAPTPSATPTPAPAKHSALDDGDPNAFGVVAVDTPTGADEALAAKLAQLGQDRQSAISAAKESGGSRSVEDLGAVVAGVNDAPKVAVFPDQTDDADPPASAPMSAAALAQLKAGIARYGDAAVAANAAAPATPGAPVAPRSRGFDASEGTPLDPLLNRTYDLSFAHTVPPLEN
jgi:peptidoglycan lytic transglycosylase G